MSLSELAAEQVKSLPEEMAREVLDFIGFLKERQERAEWQDLVHAQASTMKIVWNSAGDEVWHAL